MMIFTFILFIIKTLQGFNVQRTYATCCVQVVVHTSDITQPQHLRDQSQYRRDQSHHL